MSAPSFAGIGGHHSARSQTDEWLTPRAVIDALGGVDSFDLDPASPVVRPWPTARHHFTQHDNGLIQAWYGRVWLNPPYSQTLLRRFMGRMAAHGCGTALIFARTETETFSRFVWNSASAVLFIKGRLNFHMPDGSNRLSRSGAAANAGAPSVLCAYGQDDADVLAECGIAGQFVPLRIPRLIAICALEQTWLGAVVDWMRAQSGPIALADIYRAFARHPKAQRNPNYQAKIRQVLQSGPFQRVRAGVWAAE